MSCEEVDNRRLLAILLVFCLVDLFLTAGELHFGLIEEANPMMDYLAQISLSHFMLVKAMLTALCAVIFYRHIKNPVTGLGLYFTSVCYAIVVSIHIHGLTKHLTYIFF